VRGTAAVLARRAGEVNRCGGERGVSARETRQYRVLRRDATTLEVALENQAFVAACGLYESVGFRAVNRYVEYRRAA
jgi:ribosomal protein S18 acetylase RimI-like enzyme